MAWYGIVGLVIINMVAGAWLWHRVYLRVAYCSDIYDEVCERMGRDLFEENERLVEENRALNVLLLKSEGR